MTAWQSKECWSQGSKTAGDSWPVGVVSSSSSTADQGARCYQRWEDIDCRWMRMLARKQSKWRTG